MWGGDWLSKMGDADSGGGDFARRWYAQHQIKAVKPLGELFGITMRLGHGAESYVAYIVRHVRVWDLAAYYPLMGIRRVYWKVAMCVGPLAAITGDVRQMRAATVAADGVAVVSLGADAADERVGAIGEQVYADRFYVICRAWADHGGVHGGDLLFRGATSERVFARWWSLGRCFAVVMMGLYVAADGILERYDHAGEAGAGGDGEELMMHEVMACVFMSFSPRWGKRHGVGAFSEGGRV